MFKICAIVSSYFPDLVEFGENIESYLPWVDKLIIWENTPGKESKINVLTEKLNSEKIEVRTTGQNEFLAKPFNICIQWAKEAGFTHILTMDQDSRFENGHFEKYLKQITQLNNDSVAIYAPNTQNSELKQEPVESDFVITSGNILPLRIFNTVGLFNEDFLIYNVDTEFCMRVRSKGLKIISFTNISLVHSEGYKRQMKIGFVLNNYSAQSTYYIIRNTILLWKLYPQNVTLKEKFTFCKFKIGFRLAKIIFEDDSLRKIKAIFLAIIHGYLSRKGRYDL